MATEQTTVAPEETWFNVLLNPRTTLFSQYSWRLTRFAELEETPAIYCTAFVEWHICPVRLHVQDVTLHL